VLAVGTTIITNCHGEISLSFHQRGVSLWSLLRWVCARGRRTQGDPWVVWVVKSTAALDCPN